MSSAPKKCTVCKKKLPLIPFDCKCGGFFCGLHRAPDTHECKFNFHDEYKKQLAAAIGDAVVGDKLGGARI